MLRKTYKTPFLKDCLGVVGLQDFGVSSFFYNLQILCNEHFTVYYVTCTNSHTDFVVILFVNAGKEEMCKVTSNDI